MNLRSAAQINQRLDMHRAQSPEMAAYGVTCTGRHAGAPKPAKVGDGTATTQVTKTQFCLKSAFLEAETSQADRMSVRKDYVVSVLEGFYRHAPDKPAAELARLMEEMTRYMDVPEEECEAAWIQHKESVVGVSAMTADGNADAEGHTAVRLLGYSTHASDSNQQVAHAARKANVQADDGPAEDSMQQHRTVDKAADQPQGTEHPGTTERPGTGEGIRYVYTEVPSTEADQQMMDHLFGNVDLIPDTQEGTEGTEPGQRR